MIINKQTILELAPDLQPKRLVAHFTRKQIYFNNGVKDMLGIKREDKAFLHFATMERNTLMFFCNDDDSGFRVVHLQSSRANRGFIICSVPLILFFKKKLDIVVPGNYYVQSALEKELHGRKLFEILISKPIKELGK